MTLVNDTRQVERTLVTLLRTLIVGAGEAGRALARDLSAAPQFGLLPVGFLDDDSANGGSRPCPCSARSTVAGSPCARGSTWWCWRSGARPGGVPTNERGRAAEGPVSATSPPS